MKTFIVLFLAIALQAQADQVDDMIGYKKETLIANLAKDNFCYIAAAKYINKDRTHFSPNIVCVKDGVQKKGQPDEIKGCMMTVINLKVDQMWGWGAQGDWMPIVDKPCEKGGFNELMKRKYMNDSVSQFLYSSTSVGVDLDLVRASDDQFKAIFLDIKSNKGKTSKQYESKSIFSKLGF
jgi:hypothetical protein